VEGLVQDFGDLGARRLRRQAAAVAEDGSHLRAAQHNPEGLVAPAGLKGRHAGAAPADLRANGDFAPPARGASASTLRPLSAARKKANLTWDTRFINHAEPGASGPGSRKGYCEVIEIALDARPFRVIVPAAAAAKELIIEFKRLRLDLRLNFLRRR